MAEKGKPKAVSAATQERWSKAVAEESRAFQDAQSGDQMARLKAFRALRELDASDAANVAESKGVAAK